MLHVRLPESPEYAIYVVGVEDQIFSGRAVHLSERNIDGMVFFGKKSNKPKKQKRFFGIFPFKLQFLQKKLPPVQYRKA